MESESCVIAITVSRPLNPAVRQLGPPKRLFSSGDPITLFIIFDFHASTSVGTNIWRGVYILKIFG
jgi:hypothetical protein